MNTVKWFYIYDLSVNSFCIILFLNDFVQIKRFQVLLSNTDNSI